MIIFVILSPWLVPMKNIKSNNRVQKKYAILRIEIWVIRLFLNLRYYMKTFKSHSVFFRLRKIIFWNQTSFSLFTINIFKDFQSLSKSHSNVYSRWLGAPSSVLKLFVNNLFLVKKSTAKPSFQLNPLEYISLSAVFNQAKELVTSRLWRRPGTASLNEYFNPFSARVYFLQVLFTNR